MDERVAPPRRPLTVDRGAAGFPGQGLLDLPLDAERLLRLGSVAGQPGRQRQGGAVQLAQDLLAQDGANVAGVGAHGGSCHGRGSGGGDLAGLG